MTGEKQLVEKKNICATRRCWPLVGKLNILSYIPLYSLKEKSFTKELKFHEITNQNMSYQRLSKS